jgi:alpha-beta hydrolase superfamily lysophospholipase
VISWRIVRRTALLVISIDGKWYCLGIDNIGHGDSPGIPCYIPDYTFLIEDNLAYAAHLVSHYEGVLKTAQDAQSSAAAAPTEGEESKAVEAKTLLPKRIPLFLLGESMGGAVAIMVAHDGRVKVDGVILIAPMCGIDPVS